MCPKDQAPLEEVGKDPIIGALIDDRYVIDSVIGKGSSGIVYKASRLMMGGDVAVKVIHSYLGADSASLDRLLRELKAAERLRHAHVITVWDSGTTDDGQPYLVMDYCEGITLSQLITQKGALPPKRVLNVLRQVTEALAHAHEQGFIHRDMKPENIVLEESELRGDYVKVLDFGIADTPAESAQRAKFNKPKTVAGSPAYMSPEQCQGFELDYRSDLYSLAVIAFEMFTGRRPFLAHDLMKLMYMTVTEPPPKMGQVRKDLSFPDRVEAVIAKALSKLPDERQPTIRDFWKELEQACEGQDFGKSDRVKQTSREQQNVADLEILPSERLIDDEKPKRPQFEAGPEDMPELFMPPPPPPKSNASPEDAAKPSNSSPPPPPPPSGGAPARGPGIASLVNKQQPGAAPAPAKPPAPGANSSTPGPSVSGTVKPLQPTRIGPGGAKLPTSPAKPGEPQRPGGPRPPGPGTGPTAGKGPSGPPGSSAPPGPPKAPPPPGAPGSGGPRPAGGPPPSPTAAPPLPTKPPSPNPSNGPAMGLESSDAHSQFPDKTMSRLSALVKRPTSSMAVPSAAEFPPAPAKPAAEPAPERPPSVYSYVPPKEEKPPAPDPEAKTESNNNQNPSAGPKPTALPAKPGGPSQAKPGGPGGPKPGGPGGPKPGGPNQVKPGGSPQGSKPGAGPNPGGPGGAKPNVQNRPSGAPGGPSGAKTGESPAGNKPAGAAPQGSKPAPTGAKPASKPDGASPSSAKPADKPESGKAESNKPEPNKAESKPASEKDKSEDSELTPALARAGATWVESSAEWDSIAAHSLDGNLDESKQSPQRRISNLDWEDEIEALKTGSVDPIVIEPGPGGELLNSQQSGAWPPGMVPPGGPQNPNQMPPQGMPPGYPPQSWPPGMMPAQPMMPGYDQNMSYPPGMMHPYMQPPGYPPPGYPLPPNQDVSGAYPMMPNYPPMPPPGQDVSGTYQIPGYMPPGQGYPYGAPGMPMMMPGMPGMPPQGMPPGIPPQGMPPGMVPQGMPPGMVPQGMPPGMVPQGYPPGMPPQGMPPFMNSPLPDSVSGGPGGLGSALLDDLKSDFGDTPQGDNLDDLFEDVPPEEEAPKAEAPKVEEEKKSEFAKESEPASSNEDLAVPLDKFEKFEDTDESLKQKELAAKSEAEAAELGDSLLALMESTEKDRGGSFTAEKSESKPEKTKAPEKKDESPKSTGSRALGSLLGALTASEDDLEEPAESEESGGNAFAAAVASSASVPSLTEKSKKSSSAFGQLLAAVKEEGEGRG